jgi:hypothetical protein
MPSNFRTVPATSGIHDSAGRTSRQVQLIKIASSTTATAPWLLLLFVFSVLLPIYFYLGETRLSLARIFLLAMSIPLAVRLFTGAAGRLLPIDILMFIFSGWVTIVILYQEGIGRIPFAGITSVETVGGYLVGRTLIRNATDYRNFLRYLFISQLILLPFAILEFFTNINILQNIFRPLFYVYEKSDSQTWRNGFARVMSGFEHPILFGLFCAITVAPFFYSRKSRTLVALYLSALPFGMTYLSLSSAPLLAAGLCVLLIAWDYVSGGRWKLLLFLAGFVYLFLIIVSSRGPIVILIDNLTFSAHTAWTRIWIYTYGSAEVLRHPFLGMGIDFEWQRPPWLTGSVDNFWLLTAMRYGLPGIILLALSLIMGMREMIKAKGLSSDNKNIRTGHVIALVSLYFALATVHIWGDISSFFMCFIGAGVWLGSAGNTAAAKPDQSGGSPAARTKPDDSEPLFQHRPVVVTGQRSGALPASRFANTHHRVVTTLPIPLESQSS